jgi:hypothetical protein
MSEGKYYNCAITCASTHGYNFSVTDDGGNKIFSKYIGPSDSLATTEFTFLASVRSAHLRIADAGTGN